MESNVRVDSQRSLSFSLFVGPQYFTFIQLHVHLSSRPCSRGNNDIMTRSVMTMSVDVIETRLNGSKRAGETFLMHAFKRHIRLEWTNELTSLIVNILLVLLTVLRQRFFTAAHLDGLEFMHRLELPRVFQEPQSRYIGWKLPPEIYTQLAKWFRSKNESLPRPKFLKRGCRKLCSNNLFTEKRRKAYTLSLSCWQSCKATVNSTSASLNHGTEHSA